MSVDDPEHDEADHDESDHDESDHDESDHDESEHDEPEPVADRTHDTSWSANLEQPAHAADAELLVSQAVDAVEHTAPGNHVNLVTHAEHGHPADYLYDALETRLDDATWEYVRHVAVAGT